MDARAAAQPPEPVFLKDYRPPAFQVEDISLHFELDPANTLVTALTRFVRTDPKAKDLVLDGHDSLELLDARLDGETVAPDRLARDGESLTVADVPERFTLRLTTRLNPAANTRLEGLYLSGRCLTTQCEAEGFRCITFFLDRPDVMARYTVRMEASKAEFPVLLSNGNRLDHGPLDGGRHYAVWQDPFPKPCYLFALVAGDLTPLSDQFITRSGRAVTLTIWTASEDQRKCHHAMAALKRAMRWDEQVYGLEYDLDVFNIVAVSDFNMGAMENKSLNIFNTKYVLASPETATDDDYDQVESVIAHEYFHNWTGNRITCRDWFQLSLKEGLTVFRDQQYSASVSSAARQRINQVRMLRGIQFPEDAGPLAHPVRPESYIEINNFYTPTVYNKGAELIRMMHTILGADGYRKGIDRYIEAHDGQAVTCEDFVAAMEAGSGRDLGAIRLWYAQAGTPVIEAAGDYDPVRRRYVLTLSQTVPDTPGQNNKAPMPIPVAMALFGPNGHALDAPLVDGAGERRGNGWLLMLTEASQQFVFADLPAPPIPSLLRDFSAPVRLKDDLRQEDRLFLLAHETDAFARWDAGQQALIQMILDLVSDRAQGRPPAIDPALIDAFRGILEQPDLDPALAGEMLTLPSEVYLGQVMDRVDVEGLHKVRGFVRRSIATALTEPLIAAYERLRGTDEAGARRLKNVALSFLAASGSEGIALAETQFHDADSMTDRLAAFQLLVDGGGETAEEAIVAFYNRFRSEPLVLDKWFTVQAIAQAPDTLEKVRALTAHPDFTIKNPNRLRALIGAFASGNQAHFHRADGAGYALLTDILLKLDPLNPQTAARMVQPLTRWKRFDPGRQAQMRAELERLAATPKLSRDMFEMVTKSLS